MYKSLLSIFPSFLIIFVCSAPSLYGQILQKDTLPPKNQVEVIRFSDSGSDNPPAPKYAGNIVKVAPLAFMYGYFPLFYEREITNWLGIQAAAGVTFRPFLADTELFKEFYVNAFDCECGNYRDYSYRDAKLGFLMGVSPRLYIKSEGLEGTYFAPEVRWYSWRTKAQKPAPDYNLTNARLSGIYDEEKIHFTDVMVHCGWQTLYPRLSLDWSVGVGLRYVSGTWQSIYNGTSGESLSHAIEQSDKQFRFDVGLRLGFQI